MRWNDIEINFKTCLLDFQDTAECWASRQILLNEIIDDEEQNGAEKALPTNVAKKVIKYINRLISKKEWQSTD